MFKLSRRKLLLSSAALAAGVGHARSAFAQSDQTATLKLQGFGGEAELSAVTNAVARFNKKFPNVTVEISMDPISNGLGRLCDQGDRRVQRGNRGRRLRHRHRDLPGLLVARPVAWPQRFRCGQFRLLGLCAEPVRARLVQGGDPVHPDQLEQHHDQLQPRPFRQGQASPIPSRAGRGRSSARSPRRSPSRTAPAPSRSSATRCRTRISSSSHGSSATAPACSRTTGRVRTCSIPRSPRACSSCTI